MTSGAFFGAGCPYGSKGEILIPGKCFPLCPRQQTCGDYAAMTGSCHQRKLIGIRHTSIGSRLVRLSCLYWRRSVRRLFMTD